MITCDLIGQTGNQMFQIAVTMAMALDNGDEFQIPEHSINRQEWPLHYKKLPKFDPADEAKLKYIFRERFFQHDPIPYNPMMKIHGYFQSEKYFAHRRQEVINLFKREWNPNINRESLYALYNTDAILVAVHVRRGDYLRHPNKFISPTREWLARAMTEMIRLLLGEKRRIEFVFFSDDIGWCLEQFGEGFLGAKINYSSGRPPLEDMAMIAACDHQIISASTFSWWGAWLNENPTKVVIAPRVWFGPGNSHLNYKDVIPETWIKM